MITDEYLDKIRDTESTEAYFWTIETFYQLHAISADEHTRRMNEYAKLEEYRIKELMERFK